MHRTVSDAVAPCDAGHGSVSKCRSRGCVWYCKVKVDGISVPCLVTLDVVLDVTRRAHQMTYVQCACVRVLQVVRVF
jgi:hypothetical protein